MAANGQLVFTDVDKVTFKGVGNTSNAVIDTTTGKIGVGVDSPDANLHVLGNCFVSTNLELGGTMTMGTVTVNARHELSAITATGNTTPHTIQFTNPTTAFTTTGNVEVGGDISISSNLKMNDVVFINATGERAVAVGYQAGETGQGVNTVAVGYQAGQTSQTRFATAVGNLAGQTSQSDSAVAIGGQAGQTSQGAYSVAVGQLAGASSQQGRATAVGYLAGNSTQGQFAIAIGNESGKTRQSTKAVAVGVEAGKTDQGVNAIAVGYLAGETDQGDNSIILNATGVALDSTTASSFHVKPVRGGNFEASALAYTSTGEIVEETNTHFDTNGNVGIGTTNPLSELDIYNPVGTELIVSRNAGSSVNPTIRLWNFDDNNYNNHSVGTSIGTINFSGNERLAGDTHTDNSRAFSYANTLYDWARISALFAGSSSGATTTSGYVRGDLAFYTNNGDGATSNLQERMRIKHDGNVGIGTTSPTQKLDVNGYIKQTNTYFFVSDTTTSFTTAQTYGDTELIDRGGNWSTTTKRFTAPVKGLYTFTFVGYTVTNEHYGLGYNSDNPDTGTYQTKALWSINGGTGGSHTWTLEMEASDYITLRLYDAGNLTANRCYFMGGLLYAV